MKRRSFRSTAEIHDREAVKATAAAAKLVVAARRAADGGQCSSAVSALAGAYREIGMASAHRQSSGSGGLDPSPALRAAREHIIARCVIPKGSRRIRGE